jgi:hypothetical protein
MRPVVLLAGLVLSLASAAGAQPTAKPTCTKPATLIAAVNALFGGSTCRAPPAKGAPGAGPAVGQPARREPERAAASEPARAAPPRLAGTMCREALPSYDAGGQATYLPSRACGRY